jgi:hypothetical protein
MSFATLYGLFVAGIILSVLVPIAVKWVTDAQKDFGKGSILRTVWNFAKPILKFAAGSAILGAILLLVFLAGGTNVTDVTWYNAILYGYGWDATLQKIREARKR